MALFTEDRLRTRAQSQLNKGNYGSAFDTFDTKAKNIVSGWINEQRSFSATTKSYDIFLSHSSNDATLVSGLKLELEDLGYTVYIDWIEDPKLDRSQVTKETALLLQARMKQCKSLIYAFSENATSSKWMPWELGYFDGMRGKVAVLPISKTYKGDFKGSEYLGIYYYIQLDTISGSTKQALWVHEKSNKYTLYDNWVKGGVLTER